MARKAAIKPDDASKAKPARAPRKTVPSPETLSALGLDRLIGLILHETGQNAAFKKRVTAALASLQGPDAVASLVDRRLTALERAHGYVDWQKRRVFAADLDGTVSTIVSELAPLAADAALDRLIRFITGAEGVLGRVDDSAGQILAVYERATHAAAEMATQLPPKEAAQLAIRLVPLLDADGFGILDALLLTIVGELPDAAIGPVDAALAAAVPEGGNRAAKSLARASQSDQDLSLNLKRMRLMRMRQALADRRGDVDAFIALEQAIAPERPDLVLVADRLLDAGRAKEALDWIRRPQRRGVVMVTREQLLTGSFDPEEPARERVALEIRILDALGKTGDAQGLRWTRFEETLDRDMLRGFVAKLPDFEDEEALERAFDHAAGHKQPYRALHFLLYWPKLDRAARLVLAKKDFWDGGRYEVLAPAAEALEEAHPLAASLLYRCMINDMLSRSRSSAYGHGARHFARLDALADRIEPGTLDPAPTAYREGLRKAHGRKAAFWTQVKG